MKNDAIIFWGRSNPQLGRRINEILGLNPGAIKIGNFSDGEITVKLEDNVRGKDVFIIQSTNPPAENILELLLIIDAARRASAGRITVVLPYYGYARQDRKDQPRVPISARLILDTIVAAGANRIMAMDLHSTQIQGFVNIPFDHLYAKPIFLEPLRKLVGKRDFSIVTPDVGGIKVARSYAKILGLPLTIIDKRRPKPNMSEVMNVIGKSDMKHALIIDDMIDTGGSVTEAAALLKEHKTETITIVATHGLFSGDCVKRLSDSPIDRVIVTDSVAIPEEKHFAKLQILSAAPMLAEAIKRIHNEESISSLFEL
ncbi:MAG TPA: ribose-phosphate pyrophosphokinase [Candidatus Marinimicrobia bacterium]|nr:ribose-phosphate pyrophosphokinase [Candidatus Neomarinimicrobiota bacterium]HRS52257.1 ribose-phosphate pyrophosphokinase [Candidatus Neomarinimicrobiota bacterium]HRU91944.1 ribose-phosphate pyrophosphokinase [Candidatus Neomarinimicrobiota bacterium]